MRATRWWLAGAAASTALWLTTGWVPSVLAAVLVMCVYTWTRPQRATTPAHRGRQRPLPKANEPCRTWGYVIPLAEPDVWTPGYVGITRRLPRERWEDEDHKELRELAEELGLPLDYGDAWTGIVGDTWAEAREWEDGMIGLYARQGAPLLNSQGMPGEAP